MSQNEIRSWTRLKSRVVYSNPWIVVEEDQVRLPNGHTTIYGVVTSRTHFVGIVPLIDRNTMILVRQYRYIQDEVTWEIPSGGIEEKESPKQAAQRELRQEIGYEAQQLSLVNIMHSNKSIMRDKGYIYVAEGLMPSKGTPDETEDIKIIVVPFQKAVAMVRNYEITDCVSIIGILLAENHLKTQTR